jgi:outer membrane protein TolC
MKPDSSPFVSQLKRRPTPHPRAIPSSRLSRLCSVGLAAVVSGCAVGPNFQRPAPPAVDRFTPSAPATTTESGPLGLPGGDAQTLEIGQDLDAQWWTLFHCPELDALAAQAIRANPDLASARAALKAAQAEVRVQAAGYFPTADLSSQASREKDSTTLSPTLNSPIERFSLYTAQLSIAYSPDVFGGVRRTVENAKALAEQQRYELEASYLTITTNVANAVIQAAALKAEIDANQRLVDIGRDLLNLYRQEKALGQLAQADVAGQIAQLAQAEAQLLPLRRQLAQQQDLIADLTGGFTQPIFEGGQLLAKQREAEAQLDQAKAQYRSTVLSAFQNVADSLQAVEIDAQALRAAAQAERASLQSMEIARDQQRLGQISGAQVLITEQVYQTALQAEVQAQAARYSDTVALFQALGGGWWNRKGPA